MDLVARTTAAADLPAALDRARGAALLWRCGDADTATSAAALAPDRRRRALGLWLEVGPGYPAQVAARDVKTVAALVGLEHVVVAAPTQPAAHAAVLAALLGEGPVDFANEVAVVRGAYNRPAPAGPLRVWAYEDGRLVSGRDVAHAGATGRDELGEWTSYSVETPASSGPRRTG